MRTWAVVLVLFAQTAFARDWYVSIGRGKGKEGTKEAPAKDLGNIADLLQPGDKVLIAQGTYVGKGANGSDEILVPVSIVAGYDDAFEKRDPWGAHRTVFTGDNKSTNYRPLPRLRIDLSRYQGKEMPPILIDGLIVDQGAQNRYLDATKRSIVRAANPATGENPTPDRGAIVVGASKTGDPKGAWKITVQNNLVLNSAPTQGVITVSGYQNSEVTIRNNAAVNCTGSGIFAGSFYRARDATLPKFTIDHNTVLFTWPYDGSSTSFSGESLKLDDSIEATVTNNVFAFADRISVVNHTHSQVVLKDNLIVGAKVADYYEAAKDAKIKVADLEDEAAFMKGGGNVSEAIKVPVSQPWAEVYGARVLVDRNKVEANIKATNNGANALRSMLGLPVQAGTVAGKGGDVWLPQLSVDDAVAAASQPYLSKYGASKP